MLAAAVKALSQILSPQMRSILWKSIGMALVLITVLSIAMQRLLNWAATAGGVWAEGMIGDIDPDHPGMELYAGEAKGGSEFFLYNAQGTRLSDDSQLFGGDLSQFSTPYAQAITAEPCLLYHTLL